MRFPTAPMGMPGFINNRVQVGGPMTPKPGGDEQDTISETASTSGWDEKMGGR